MKNNEFTRKMWRRFLKRNTTLRHVIIHIVALLEREVLLEYASSLKYHFMEIKMVLKLARLLRNALRKPKVFEMTLAIVLLGKSFCNNIRKDKNNGSRLLLHVIIDRSGRNLKPLKN